MENDLLYYENKLDIIIHLLNRTNDERVLEHLLLDYSKTYDKYYMLYNKANMQGE